MASPQVEEQGLVGIGEVLAQLREEFTDISISKIRFLESTGLVRPARTSSGYRKFSALDIDRLRYVLRMQRDHFLPLRVIRDHIEAMNRGLQPPAVESARPTPPRPLASIDSLARSAVPTGIRLTSDELAEHAGAKASTVSALRDFGLIRPDSSGHYDGLALSIVTVCATLQGFGLEPRHLKTVLSSATREVDLFSPVIAAARSAKNPASNAQAEELTLQITAAVADLHTLLLRMIIERA